MFILVEILRKITLSWLQNIYWECLSQSCLQRVYVKILKRNIPNCKKNWFRRADELYHSSRPDSSFCDEWLLDFDKQQSEKSSRKERTLSLLTRPRLGQVEVLFAMFAKAITDTQSALRSHLKRFGTSKSTIGKKKRHRQRHRTSNSQSTRSPTSTEEKGRHQKSWAQA